MSGESPADVVRAAGPDLAYVHLDDNDGQGDLHWPLLAGKLTESDLRSFFALLKAVGYRGGMALELNARLPDPIHNLLQSRNLVVTLASN
jgi:sugar phosphate isomerase/epimerase